MPKGRPQSTPDTPPKTKAPKAAKEIRFSTPAALDAYIWSICDILRRSGSSGAMQYVPELSWILFLRILDDREQQELEKAETVGSTHAASLAAPYRWRDWAAPVQVDTLFRPRPDTSLSETARDELPQGWKRRELTDGATLNAFISWVNDSLIPHLKTLRDQPNATPRQKVIAEILSGVERTRVDTEKNLLDVLDKIHEINSSNVDSTHLFMVSQVFEGLLLKMGDKGNDGGQFFTPREVVRVMVRTLSPTLEDSVYDPCCGTGGFLAEAFDHVYANLGQSATPMQLEDLRQRKYFGREKENLIYPIALANLVLHGIDRPAIWHGNTLTKSEIYAGLFEGAPSQFDVILTNPPFGGKEGEEAQLEFAYKTSATQILFLQHILDSLKAGGRAAVVLDEGVSFRLETAFVQTKRKLLSECGSIMVLSLPPGTFINAGAGVKTNIYFFSKLEHGAKPTEKIWYYDLADVKVGKRTPLTIDRFDQFFALKDSQADSERSWVVDIAARRASAKQQSDPLRAQAQALEESAKTLTASLKAARSKLPADQREIAELEQQIKTAKASATELLGKAQKIDDAVFDLKAVNPNAKTDTDERTPEELLEFIEQKGQEVRSALEMLRGIQSMSV